MLTSRSFAAAFAVAGLALVPQAGTLAQAPTPQPQSLAPAPCLISSSTEKNDVMVLLNRMAAIIDQTVKRSPAARTARQPQPAADTAGPNSQAVTIKVKGGTANTVPIERDRLDEIRAEVDQLRVILGSQ